MRVKSRIIGITGAALLLGTLSGWCQQTQTDTQAQRGQLSEKDYRFLENAIRGGMQEVQSGELAKQKGVDQTVRNFGDRMVTDHGKAKDELKQLAASKQATIPATLSHGEQATIDNLQKSTGADFDKTYAKDMVKDHRHDVKEFQKASKDLADPDLRAWAQKTLPTLEKHLGMAETMETAVKNEK